MVQFERQGDLKNIASYPEWVRDIVDRSRDAKMAVLDHQLFANMRDAKLSESAMRAFLVNGWPVINEFPQYMGMNLQKIGPLSTPGLRMARRYLTRNIRVEQNHADYWLDWAAAHDVTREKMEMGDGPVMSFALSHWCWKTSSADNLPAAIAATNYAIEGVTGEWSTLVCGDGRLEESYPGPIRKRTMRWLKMHAHYDDAHPWEALDIVATILGSNPDTETIRDVQRSVERSYQYLKVCVDCCLQ